MPLRFGIDNTLDRLFKTKTAEQLSQVPEPEQLATRFTGMPAVTPIQPQPQEEAPPIEIPPPPPPPLPSIMDFLSIFGIGEKGQVTQEALKKSVEDIQGKSPALQKIGELTETLAGIPMIDIMPSPGFGKFFGIGKQFGKLLKPKPVKPPEPVIPPSVESKIEANKEVIASIRTKMTDYLKGAKAQRQTVEAAKKEVFVPKVQAFEERLGASKTPEDVKLAFSALSGRNLPEQGMEIKPLTEILSPAEQGSLTTYILNHPVFEGKPLTAANTLLALAKKEVPQRHELRNLSKVLGDDFVKSYLRLGEKQGWAKAFDMVSQIINIPKSLFSSFDFGSVFRQAIFQVPSYPVKTARSVMTGMQAYFRSEKWVNAVDDAIRNSQYAPLRAKLELTDLPAAGRALGKTEEAYMSNLLYRVPVIKQTLGALIKRSDRVFTLTLNKFRADVFDGYARLWDGKVGQREYDELCELINVATGRGAIGQSEKLTAAVTHMNSVLFSPRLNISRVQTLGLPVTLWKYSPAVRKVALRNIASFVGVIGGIASVIKAAFPDDVTIETDSTATDFGYLRVKDTRYDLWGGHTQFVRLASRLLTGERKTQTGKRIEIDRIDEIIKFFRLKESPAAGLIHDILKGRTVVGEELEMTSESIEEQAKQRLTPGAVQDLMDAVELYGTSEGLMASLAFASIGVNTYPSRTYMDWLDKMEDIRGKEWEIDEIAAMRPQFVEAENTWDEYLNLDGEKARRFYREANPAIEASMYFWGEINSLTTPEAYEEFKKITEEYNVSVDAYPLRINRTEFDVKDKTAEEIYYETLDIFPLEIARYIDQNKAEFVSKGIEGYYQQVSQMRERDDVLLTRYKLETKDYEPKERAKYRKEHPDIDAALNFWGRVTTTKSASAKALLQSKIDDLGLNPELYPALKKKEAKKVRSSTIPSGKIGGLKFGS